MADRPVILPVRGHAELWLSTKSGRISVRAEERADVVIEAGAPGQVEVDPTGRISLTSARGGSASLEVRCPQGTDVMAGTVSGRVELRGRLGAVRVTTVSSSVEVDQAEELDVRSISGSIDVARCNGRCRLQTKSGRAVCGATRDARVSTISGTIRLAETTGSVRAQSVSGTIEVGTARDGDVSVQTMSGAVTVAVPRGVRPATRLRSLTGRPRNACEQGDDCSIAVQSLSGRIDVVPG